MEGNEVIELNDDLTPKKQTVVASEVIELDDNLNPIKTAPLKKKVDTSYSPSFVLPKEGGTSKSGNGGLGQFAPIDNAPIPKIVEPKKQELKDFNRPLVNPRLNEIIPPIDHRKLIDDAFKITVDKLNKTKSDFSQVQQVVNTQRAELQKLEEEMSVPYDENNPNQKYLLFLADQYKKLQEDNKFAEEKYNELNDQRLKEANRISTLFRGKQVMDKPVESNIGAWEILGKSFTNAITGMVGGVGSTIEALGDMPMTPQGMLERQVDRGLNKAGIATPERDGDTAITDKIGAAFRDASKAMKLYIPKEAQESVFEGELTWKKAANTAGQVLGSIGAVVATGGVGGAAAAASTGIALTMNDTYNSAKENGLTDAEAAEFALPVSIASGMLDMVGAGSIIKNISKKELVNQLVKNSAKELAGKKITEQAVMGAMDNSIKKMFKDIGTGVVKSGKPELVTEMGQSLLQSGGENLSDIATGKENFQTKFFSKKTLIDAAENGLLGFGAGGTLGGLTSIKSPQNYKEALKLKDPANAAQYGEYIDAEITQGRMTPQQKVDIENNIKKTIEVDAKIPEYIKSDNDRYEASQLIEEKQTLQEQAKGLDVALATPMNDRIAQIDEELVKIANKNGADIPIKEKPEGHKFSNTEVLKPKEVAPTEIKGYKVIERMPDEKYQEEPIYRVEGENGDRFLTADGKEVLLNKQPQAVEQPAPTENINQLKTIENATKEGNITENNQQQYQGATELQQGEQTNRGNQESNVTTSQAETGGGDSSIESGEKQKEVGSGVGGDVVKLNNGNIVIKNIDKSVKKEDGHAHDVNWYDINDELGNNIGNISIADKGDYYQVSNVKLKKEKTGLGTELYTSLSKKLDKPLYSDPSLTDASKALWEKLVFNGVAEKYTETVNINTDKTKKSFNRERYRTDGEIAPTENVTETPQEQTPEAKQVETDTKQQIENFGVAKDQVEPVHNVISQVFQGLKKAGLTAAKTVGEWVGIGKGEEKPYSLKINGKDTQVKNVAPEVVDGFYSPLEKTIGETKFDKLPAKQWIEKFAKGEEAKWTGLNEWLSKQEGSVSKSDIQKYLKENRISVVEVVKGGENDDLMNRAEEAEKKFGVNISLDENPMDGSPDVIISGEKLDNMTDDEIQELQDEVNDFVLAAAPETKFSQYQLEGEKSNYKEVLVTMPSKGLPEGYEVKKVVLSNGNIVYRANGDGLSTPHKNYQEAENELKDRAKEFYGTGKLGGAKFKSSHFDEPNILVHLRMNTRVDAEGKKVLFLEEVQSDWGQEGKKEGFEKPENTQAIKELENEKQKVLDSSKSYQLLNDNTEGNLSVEVFDAIQQVATNMIDNQYSTKESRKERFLDDIGKTLSYWRGFKNAVPEMNQEELSNFYDIYIQELENNSAKIKEYGTSYRLASVENKIKDINKNIFDFSAKTGTSSAPFVTDTNAWTKLGLKVALKEAVKQGADKIAWSTGTQQFDRWGSEKISWKKEGSKWKIDLKEQESGNAFDGINIDEKALSESNVSVSSKEQLREVLNRNLKRERNDSEIDKLTDRIWNRMQTEDSGTSLPRKEGMEAFYGVPTEVDLVKVKKSDSKNPSFEDMIDLSLEGGELEIGKVNGAKVYGVTNLKVDENKRKQGIATNLLKRALDETKGELSGMASNDMSVGLNYKLGMRATENGVELSLEETKKARAEKAGNSIRMILPENKRGKNYKPFRSLGIVGNVAKSLTKQEPKTVEIEVSDSQVDLDTPPRIIKLRNGEYVVQTPFKDSYVMVDGEMENPTFKDLSSANEFYINETNRYNKEIEKAKKTTQHSIDITPELKASVEGGQPLFKDAEAQYRIENGKNIVEAIKDFNGSPRATVALTHEIMHPTVVAIIDGAKDGNEVGVKHTQTIVDEYNKANPKNKVTVDELIKGNDAFKEGTTSKQYRDVQEFIAESWEKYHTEGAKGFSAEFQKVLDQITQAFKAVYNSLTEKQITPELRKMFDEILGKSESVLFKEQIPTIENKNLSLQNGNKKQGSGISQIKVNSEKVQYNGTDAIGSRGRTESEKDTARKEAREKINNLETNAVLKSANDYNASVGLPKIERHEYKPSDPVQQTEIAKIYPLLQDVNSPTYKETNTEIRIYSEYKSKYPKIFKQFDIKGYKDLVNKSYGQLIYEIELQFNSLPVKVSFHDGDKNYENSAEMIDDVHNFNHLWVYKGGDDHTALGSKTMDKNGLTANDKFRAVHDYETHAAEGYQFGKNGEENAWIQHSKMLSPLAQWALSSETRGQNSWVNYSGVNDLVLKTIDAASALKKQGKKIGNQEMIDEADKLLSTVYDDIQFAEQKAIILPEKYTNAEQFFNKNKSLLPKEQKVELLPKELTEKEQVSKELQDAKDAFKKASQGFSSGGLQALPEFVNLVKAYVKMGILTAKDFVKQFRKDFPESKASDFDLANGFNESKPKETSKETEQKVSQHYQTVSDNVDTPAEWTANAKKDPAMYNVITNKETLKEAKKFIRNAGTIQDAANKLIESGSNYSETPLNVQVGAAYMLYGNIFNEAVKSRENGDIETATSLFEMSQKLATAMSQKLTKAGQGIQAASFLLKSLETIEGVNMVAQKAVAKNNERQTQKNAEKAKKQAKQISDVIKEAEEKTFAVIEEKFKETTEAKLKRIKAKRERLREKYKGVRLFSSTAVPGLTSDGIEYAGSMLATYVEEGIVKTEELYKKLKEHFAELGHNLSDEDITNIQDKIAQNKKEKLEGQVAKGDISGAMKTVGLGTTISQIARRHYSEIESTREKLKNSIVDELGLTDTEAQKVADFIEAEYNKNVKSKIQELLTKTKEKKYTVKQKLLSDTEKLLAANKAGALDEKVIFDLFKEKYKIAEWTLEDAEYAQKQLEKIAKVEEGSFKAIEYYENILNRVNSKKSFDLMTAMDEAWYGSVLSGGGTTDQNVSFGVLTFQNAIYEQAISKLTEGVVSGKPMLQLNNLVQSLFSLKQGMSNTINNAKYILKHGSKSFADDISQLDINARGEIDWSKANLGLLNAFKYSTRFLSAQDAVFTGNIKNWFLAPHLQDFYKKQGLSGKELNNAVMNDLLKVESKRADAENQAKEEEKLDYEIVNKNGNFYVNYKDKPHKIFTTDGKAIEYIEEQSKKGLVYKRRVNEIMNSEINKEVLKKSAATAKRYVLTGIPTGTAGSLYQLLNKGMSALREKAQKSDNAITKGAVFGLTKVIPFIKVPLNIVDFTIDYTPLGYMRAFGKRGIVANFGKTTAGGREDFGAVDRNLLLIRATQGTAILATYIMNYMFGDDDKEEFNKDAVNDFNKRFGTDIKIDNPLFKMPKDGELVGSLGYLDAPQKKFLQDYGLAAEYSEYDAKSKTWKSFLNNPDGFMKGLVGTLSSYDKYIFKNKYQKTQSQMEKNSTPMMLSYLMFGTIDQFLQQSSLKGAQTLVQNLSYQQGDVGKKATELAKTVLLQPLAILNPALLRQAVKYWDGVAHEQINPLEKNEKGELNQVGNFLMQYLPVYGSFVMGRPRYNMFGQEIKQLPGERTGNFTNAIAKATGDMSKQNIVSSFLYVNGYTTPKIIPNNLMAIKEDGSVIYITDEQKSRLGAAAGRKAYDEILKRIEGKTDEEGFIVIGTKFNSEGEKFEIKRRSLVTIVNKMKDKDRMKRSVPFNKEINSIFNRYYDEVWKDEIKKQGWVFTKPK